MVKLVDFMTNVYDIYIGKGTKWENPFEIIDNKEESKSRYEAYIMDHPTLIDDLPELENKVLGYWLIPYHGEILKRMVEDRIWEK